MPKSGKSCCQICQFVDKGHMFYIKFLFDYNLAGVIYLTVCRKCSKIYVGSLITIKVV